MENLSVRPLENRDINLISDYWLYSEPAYLEFMGVDLKKMPAREEWISFLQNQLDTPTDKKPSYCLIWEADGVAVGHSNINKIIPGEEAYLHIHLWQGALRNKGWGLKFIQKSIPHFFEVYDLKTLYCEPYALNPAPNRLLKKAGFIFEKEYTTVPGSLNFEQRVSLWRFEKEMLDDLNKLTV